MDVRTGFFATILVALGGVALLMVAPFVQYLAAAGLLAFLLFPLHRRLERRVDPRVSAFLLVAGTLVAAIVPLVVLSAIVLDTVRSFAREIDQIVALIESIEQYVIEEFGVDVDLFVEIEGVLIQFGERLMQEMVGLVTTTVRIGVGALLIVFVLYYLLVDGRRLLAWIRAVVPLEEPVQDELTEEIRTTTWAVLQSHIFVAIVEGILGGIGFYLIGVPNAAFWTAVMIVASILPVVGVWLVWGPAVVYLFVTDQLLGSVVLLVYGLTVLAFVDNYLRAIFVDHRVGLNPATVLVGVLGGLYLFGVVGLFLGPILLAVFKASVNVFSRTYGDDASDTVSEGDHPPA